MDSPAAESRGPRELCRIGERSRGISHKTSSPGPGTDEALAVAAAGGSRRAFEALVVRYGGRVVAALRNRLDDDHLAMDLAQEAWIRVMRALPRFRPDRNFRAWLFSIALNAARDEGRRRRRSRLAYVDDLGEMRDPPKLVERSTIDEVLSCVAEPFRTALMLVDVEGLAYEDAAAAVDCKVGTMKSRVHRGRIMFRDLWDPRPDRGSRQPSQTPPANTPPASTPPANTPPPNTLPANNEEQPRAVS